MLLYTSRYSNPELRSRDYTTVQISIGRPKWQLGYHLDAEMYDLMPFGLLNRFEKHDDFERSYFVRLNQKGVNRIRSQLLGYEKYGKDVVLLCYEDIRKGESDWCHRTMFAKWWYEKTGEMIPELPDPTTPKIPKARTKATVVQLTMF